MVDAADMPLLPIRRTLSIMLTYKCNAECVNCGTFSSPRVRGRLAKEKMMAAIHQAAELNFENVVFTGGEATLYFGDLIEGIGKSRSLGLPTRLVSNGIWASKAKKAHETITNLKEAGLNELNLSTGDEHARFVPFEAVKLAAELSLTNGIRTHIMIEKFKGASFRKENFLSCSLLSKYFDRGFLSISESPWMPLDPFEKGKYEASGTINSANIDARTGCDDVLRSYVVSTDKETSVCCGLGSRFVPELKSEVGFDGDDPYSLRKIVFEAEQDFLKIWMRVAGPEKILRWCSEFDDTIEWENIYAHRCQACMRVYKDDKVQRVIREHYLKVIPDILASFALKDSVEAMGMSPAKTPV